MKTYETPRLELLLLSARDVILTSAGVESPMVEEENVIFE